VVPKNTPIMLRVLEDWCPPFPGFFLYYPSRRQQPAALTVLIDTLRLKEDRGGASHRWTLKRIAPP